MAEAPQPLLEVKTRDEIAQDLRESLFDIHKNARASGTDVLPEVERILSFMDGGEDALVLTLPEGAYTETKSPFLNEVVEQVEGLVDQSKQPELDCGIDGRDRLYSITRNLTIDGIRLKHTLNINGTYSLKLVRSTSDLQ